MIMSPLSEQNLNAAESAVESAQRSANHAVDSMGRALGGSLERAREASQQLRDSAARASEGTVNYIRHDPVKSVLIAAATGAALMALVSLLTRSNSRS